ncbi:MAG: type II secretion system major pseudopilin GspG [Bacteriovorax sp.]|nr:type II secretion system major pseudopilin GspG [Bacteriovorax sp.]
MNNTFFRKTFLEKTLVQNQQGFSLIEILIALTLLAVVGTFVGGKFFENLEEGKIKSARIQMSNMDSRLKDFRRRCGFYPTSEQGLEALVTKPTGGRECKDYPASGFIEGEAIPKDPWENDFIYESDGKTFNISSLGPDGEAGGDGNNADIFFKTPKGGGAAPTAGGAASGAEAGGGTEAAPAE